ncbi:hypothetical protein SOASR031_29270 [Leminorella grimontii]|nr:hypothetical protein SOASR031_29270 [Leminorella grimontii]
MKGIIYINDSQLISLNQDRPILSIEDTTPIRYIYSSNEKVGIRIIHKKNHIGNAFYYVLMNNYKCYQVE